MSKPPAYQELADLVVAFTDANIDSQGASRLDVWAAWFCIWQRAIAARKALLACSSTTRRTG